MSGTTNMDEATFPGKVALSFYEALIPLVLALLALLSVVYTVDVADEIPFGVDGPGLTFDESFNVETGVLLISQFKQQGLAALHPSTLSEIYQHPGYNPDHPPLARLLLGIANEIGFLVSGDEVPPHGYKISYARVASAFLFAATVFLISVFSSHWYGRYTGCFAGLALIIMPRVFAHAHFASLETAMSLMFALPLIWIADDWGRRARLPWHVGVVPGILLGLALLTKMQAVFLPPIIGVWALMIWRWRAILPLTVVYLVAFAVFFVGWPWLWSDPLTHLQQYFARTTERSTLYCYYLGERFADRDVPWHYPLLMLTITTPLTYVLAGLFGAFAVEEKTQLRWVKTRRGSLILFSVLFTLFAFSLPGIANYDGIRLFLVVTPLLAIVIGYGFASILEAMGTRNFPVALLGVLLALLFPIYNSINLHPCQLSYYTQAVGGLSEADRLGFEKTYWGDSVTPDFLRKAMSHMPEGATLDVAPVLHPLQLEFLRRGSGLLYRPDLKLRAYDDQKNTDIKYVLVIRRQADPWSSLSPPPEGTVVLERTVRDGIILTELLELP